MSNDAGSLCAAAAAVTGRQAGNQIPTVNAAVRCFNGSRKRVSVFSVKSISECWLIYFGQTDSWKARNTICVAHDNS
jgi:hypothetical protein